jgi:tetratricopeptide (TPR) repeat protein
LAERAARYRTVLAGRRVLVVLDNASGPDQVRALLPGTPSCFTLVTSRDDLAGLVARDGARRIDLDTLSEWDSIALLRTLLGPRVDDDPAAPALARSCAGLPLALRIAAELAGADPNRPLAELVADLRDERRRLDLLDTAGDPRTAVRSVFSWSYQRLSDAGMRAFRRLGLHPGPDIDADAVAVLADVDVQRAAVLVGELARAHLVEPTVAHGYRMHDLLRAYAAELAGAEDTPAARDAALTRLFDHYLDTATAATDTLFPHDRPHRTTVALPDPAAWLERQRANLVAVAVHAAEHGRPAHSVELSAALWRHFEVGGHYQEALAVHTSAVAAARATGNGRGGALANLGGIHWWLGNFRDAQACFEQSLAACGAAGDPAGETLALARLGIVHERLGEYHAALACLTTALDVHRRSGNRHGEAVQLVNIGALQRRLGNYPESAEHERRAAAMFAELGDLRLAGYALGNLGAVRSLLGHHTEALARLAESFENCRRSGDRGGEGSALGTMGAVYRRLARLPDAVEHLHRALAISRETGDRSLETETLNTLGETLHDLGQPESALARHKAALALTERSGDRYEQARALDGTAKALHSNGDLTAAEHHWQAALDIYDALGVPEARPLRGRLSRRFR